MVINLENNETFPENEISIIYDNGCPVCSYYIEFSHIEEKYGKINYIKARNNQIILNYIQSINIDINEGMIVVFDKKIYYGYDAINIISILGKRDSLKNRIVISIFKYRIVSKILYPLLKLGRRVLLFILRRKLI
tara:strand:- start:4830 stop:5234 length:405 start_codon:yes stop_codon:yes gene_type:complete